MMKNKFMLLATLGALAVVLGAFGAHALEGRIAADQLAAYHTAVYYQFIHVIMGIIACMAGIYSPSRFFRYAANSYVAGILLFSGSIYLLSTREVTGVESLVFLAPVTPLGGVLFIAGWVFLIMGITRFKRPVDA